MPSNPKPRAESTACGERLRALRTSNRLTLRDVAAYTGIALTALAKIETGQRLVTIDDLAQLRDCFGIPGVLYLIGLPA